MITDNILQHIIFTTSQEISLVSEQLELLGKSNLKHDLHLKIILNKKMLELLRTYNELIDHIE